MNLARKKNILKTELKTRLSYLRSRNTMNLEGQKQLELLISLIENPKKIEEMAVGSIKDRINIFCERYYGENSVDYYKESQQFFYDLNEFDIKTYDVEYSILFNLNKENYDQVKKILIEKTGISNYNFPSKKEVLKKYEELNNNKITEEEYHKVCLDSGFCIYDNRVVPFSLETEVWKNFWIELFEEKPKIKKII